MTLRGTTSLSLQAMNSKLALRSIKNGMICLVSTPTLDMRYYTCIDTSRDRSRETCQYSNKAWSLSPLWTMAVCDPEILVLEGDLTIRDAESVEVGCFFTRPAVTLSALLRSGFPRTSNLRKQANVPYHNLGAVDLLAALLIVPGPRGEPSFHEQLRTLMHVIA